MKKLTWPTAIVMCVAILAIVATVLAGPALGMSPETLASVLSGEGVIAALVLGVMRQLLAAPPADGGES